MTIFTQLSLTTEDGFVMSSFRWPRCCENICVLEGLMKNEKMCAILTLVVCFISLLPFVFSSTDSLTRTANQSEDTVKIRLVVVEC